MEENELELGNNSVESDSDTSKKALVVTVLAVIGGATVARKAFSKVRNYKIVKKSDLVPVPEMPSPPQEA